MKITLDTREDKEEIRKVIRLLQQIVGEEHSQPSSSTPSMDMFDSPSTNSSSSMMGMFDEPKKEETPSVFNLFGDNPPESLSSKDDDDDDDPEPIQIIDF